MKRKDRPFQVRNAKSSDARGIAVIVREALLSDSIEDEMPTDTVRRIEKQITECRNSSSHDIHVAVDGLQNVIGYATVQWHLTPFLPGGEGYVTEITVRENDRGKGVGQAIMECIVRSAKKRETARITLLNTRHRESYQRGFYVKLGWKERKETAVMSLML